MKRPEKFKPMKAAKVDNLTQFTHQERYPFLATPKWDGIRAFTFEPVILDLLQTNCELVSLSLERIPNRFIQSVISNYKIMGLDMEIVTYTNGVMDSYNTVQSKVMSRDGEPDFQCHVFDLVAPFEYWERMRQLKEEMDFPEKCHLKKCLPVLIQDEEGLLRYEERMLLAGYEGVMLRSIDGPYKFGRSTEKEGYLYKIKRFRDAEATIIGFEELMHNNNEATLDNVGNTERSSHKENLVPGGTLGALICVGHNGIEFSIGTGFDAATRQEIWNNQGKYKFQLAKYKYQPHGVKTKPRCPVFLGIRPTQDMQ